MTENPDFPSSAPGQLERMLEAMLFASAEPLSLTEMATRLPHGSDTAEAISRLRRHYEGRGMQLVRVGAGFAFRTAPDLAFLMQKHVTQTRQLSRAATETLAIIAYHQPATRAEIEEIRGVASSRGTLDQLIDLGWVRVGRRRMTPGRPATFVVTDTFLDHFGLTDASDLPGLSELRAAGLLGAGPISATPMPLAPDDAGGDIDPSDDRPGDLFGEDSE